MGNFFTDLSRCASTFKSWYTIYMWYVYLLRCEDRSIYTGVTRDVEKRFLEHKRGKGARYTRSHKPIKVLHVERYAKKGRALKREFEIKGLKRAQKEALFAP